ncbi:beta-1,6-N-acetylglucosaminyltransferase, partial [Planococcus sp. SIMBA_160]
MVNVNNCHVLHKSVTCGWGRWGLVKASLMMLDYAQNDKATDYYFLLSEYCFPIQPLSKLMLHLEENTGANFIECSDS